MGDTVIVIIKKKTMEYRKKLNRKEEGTSVIKLYLSKKKQTF